MSEKVRGKKVNLKEYIDVDKIPIRRDHFQASAFIIELPLDSHPDYIWKTFFEKEWKSSLHLWERKVVIVSDKLLLITTPAEIEDKIDWLKKVIESTNMRIERYNKTQQIIEEEEKAKASAEKEKALREHENAIRDALRIKLLYRR